MLRILPFLWLLLTATCQLNAQSDPVFVLNPAGHSSTIFKVFGNQQKNKVITVAVDKSMGVWDARTWTLVKRYWLDIGVGKEGKLIDADYFPDNDLLAVARINSAGKYVVTLLDMDKMAIIATYSGFSHELGYVHFSPSASFLVTGPWQANSGLEHFKIWKVPGSQSVGALIDSPVDTYKEGISWVHDICVTESVIYHSSSDNIREIRIAHDLRAIPEYKMTEGETITRSHAHMVSLPAINSFVAGSHNGSVSKFSDDFKTSITLDNQKSNVYSMHGGERVVASYFSQDNLVKVYGVESSKEIGRLKTVVDHIGFYNDSTVLVTNGSKLTIFFPYADSVYYPYGNRLTSTHIGFGDDYSISFIDDHTTFDFLEMTLLRERVDTSSLSLNKKAYYDKKLKTDEAAVYLERKKAKDEFYWIPGHSIVESGFSNRGEVIFSLVKFHSNDPDLAIYNDKAIQTHQLLNPEDLVVNFCPSKNTKENYVASLYQNGVVALWNVDNPDFKWTNDLQLENIFSDFTIKRAGTKLIVEKTHSHLVKIESGDEIIKLDSLQDLGEASLGAFFRAKSPHSPVTVTLLRGPKTFSREVHLKKVKEIHPVATVFVEGKEWLCWNASGYYTASAGGEKLGGWVVHKGVNSVSEFHPVYDFKKEFYRPELIRTIVTSGSVSKATELYNQSADIKINPMQSISQKLPPSIEWLSPRGDSSLARPRTRMIARVRSTSPIHTSKLLLNGRTVLKRDQIHVRSTQANEYILTSEVDLPAKENVINLFVENENGSSISDDRTISLSESANAIDRFKPNLYVVSVGVSKHQLPNYSLSFAHTDAQSVSQLYQRQTGKLYNQVFERTLLDDKATRSNILEAFYWLEQHATQRDVVIIFIASHGFSEKDKFYILPFDGDPERIRITGVDWLDFAEVLGNLPSKVMVFIDACHSGKLGANLLAKRGEADITDALRALATEENGVVIMSASTGKESSYESSDWNHGAFTLALLDGLEKGEADLNKDGVINVREIDYFISERVKALTSGRQHPTTQKPSVVGEFPILQVEK